MKVVLNIFTLMFVLLILLLQNTIKMKAIDVKSNFILNTMLMLMLIILNLNRQPCKNFKLQKHFS